MIIERPSPGNIAAELSRLRVSGELRNRTRARGKRFDAYSGRTLVQELAPYYTPKMLSQVPPDTTKICRKMVNTRAIAYKQPPERQADEKYLEMLLDLDREMQPFERATYLQGTMALLRTYHPELNKFQSTPIPHFEPIFFQGDPEPIGCAYPVGSYDKDTWVVWTIAEHFRIVGGTVYKAHPDQEQFENQLGVFPILFAHSSPSIDSHWWTEGADDLVNAQLVYNCANTLLSLGAHFQALGQPYATGVEENQLKKLVLNVTRLMRLPKGATFDYASPNADLKVIMEYAQQKVKAAGYAHDLVVKFGDGVVATSGEQLRLMEVDLENAIQADAVQWENFEERRFEIDRAILEHGYNIRIGDQYSVTFRQRHTPQTWAEKEQRYNFMLDKGLITRVKILRLENPSLTEEEAKEILAEVDAERGQQAGAGRLSSALRRQPAA